MKLNWEKMQGLIPAVVQDSENLNVLMVGYMSPEALEKTISEKRVVFFSRSKNRLWTKGETSGNFLELVDLKTDCDGDALLIQARPLGPTCHQGTSSCFQNSAPPSDDLRFLSELGRVIERRHRDLPEGSYTTTLFQAGLDRIAQKVGEEAIETIIAAKNDDIEPVCSEAADLLYHLMVLLQKKGVSLVDVARVLEKRHRKN